MSVAEVRLYKCEDSKLFAPSKDCSEWRKHSSLRNYTLIIASSGHSCSDIPILLTSAVFHRLSFPQSFCQSVLSFNMAFWSDAVGCSAFRTERSVYVCTCIWVDPKVTRGKSSAV